MEFEWDEAKAASNLVKHGIAFASVRAAFADLYAIHEEDRSMNYGEQRMRMFGMVNGVIVSVSYAERGDQIRLISARRATKHEQEIYDRNRLGYD